MFLAFFDSIDYHKTRNESTNARGSIIEVQKNIYEETASLNVTETTQRSLC